MEFRYGGSLHATRHDDRHKLIRKTLAAVVVLYTGCWILRQRHFTDHTGRSQAKHRYCSALLRAYWAINLSAFGCFAADPPFSDRPRIELPCNEPATPFLLRLPAGDAEGIMAYHHPHVVIKALAADKYAARAFRRAIKRDPAR